MAKDHGIGALASDLRHALDTPRDNIKELDGSIFSGLHSMLSVPPFISSVVHNPGSLKPNDLCRLPRLDSVFRLHGAAFYDMSADQHA